MISEAELRRRAAALGADPMLVDLDYVLGCVLSQWYLRPDAGHYRLKGGTCLRKCYFPEYRFSEDLDFSAERTVSISDVERLVRDAIQKVQEVFGIDFGVQPPMFRIAEERPGWASYEARAYYRGPLRRTGAPRAIRVDISLGEFLALPAAGRRLNHPYSDKNLFADTLIPCYALEETLVEKARALCGQRRFAISRDLYDIYQLTGLPQVELERIRPFVGNKLVARGITPEQVDPCAFTRRRAEFRRDWEDNLHPLLPASDTTSFDKAWQAGVKIVSWVSSVVSGG